MSGSTSFFSSSPSSLSPNLLSPNTTNFNISQRFQQHDYIKRNLTEKLYRIQENDDEEDLEDGSGENTYKDKCLGFFQRNLVVYKLFYFLFYGAVGSLFPYLAVFYKQLYLSAQQVGFLIGIRPFIQMATAPVWGAIADTCNVKKTILLISIATWLGTNYSISLVRIPISIACAMNDTSIRIPPPGRIIDDTSFLTNATQHMPIETGTKRRTKLKHKNISPGVVVVGRPRERRDDRLVTSSSHIFLSASRDNNNNTVSVKNDNSKISQAQRITAADEIEEEFNAVNTDGEYPWQLETNESTEQKEYAKKNAHNIFIVLIIITVLGTTLASPTATLADTATLENLDDQMYNYGFQRVWGALGWGLCAFIVGLIVSYIQKIDCQKGNHVDYILSFYVFAVMMGLAFLCAIFFRFNTVEMDQPYTQSLGEAIHAFWDCQHISFVVTLLCSGASLGFIHTFLFWHLHDLGASQTLFSLLTAVQCLSEVVMYFASGYLLSKIGYDYVLHIGLLSNILRLIAYSCISNPLYALPIEILQGISSASIWTSAVCYIGLIPGAPVTLQALLHAIYWGLGHGGGGILGGVMVTSLGSSVTFIIYSVLCTVNLVYLLLLKYRSKIMELLGNYTYVENIPAGTYILTSMSQRGTLSEENERTEY